MVQPTPWALLVGRNPKQARNRSQANISQANRRAGQDQKWPSVAKIRALSWRRLSHLRQR
jgi:hypothetical protein